MSTVGRAMPDVEIAIKAPGSKHTSPQGNPGEVCFRGWCTMKGYFDDPEKTAEALDADGWLHTGDLGVIDGDGYLALIGRIKEMIRVGGENVAAAEVESVLLKNERVKQAVAVGAPDPRLGEIVVAFIELKTGAQASESEIIDCCRGHLASFKVPRRVVFVNEWPMSGTGKIQRFVLQQSLAARPDS
jgi:acyl-CoA synthetase (AMP-forming)/AMP-acid ligase II